MPSITWLHISDLHWRESEAYDANVVAGALLRDLASRTEGIASEVEHIDFIFVTGDIAFASRPEEYILAQRFFGDLLRVTGVPKHRLFIVPGNHDVDREAISGEAYDIVAELDCREAINNLLGDERQLAVMMERFHRYKWFVNNYIGRYLRFDSGRYFYKRERRLAGKRIAVLGINSAWTSASDADRLNLFLGERQVRTALDQARRADIRIALVHHPFEWLRDFDRAVCEPLLLRDCDFLLHGHLHRTDMVYQQFPGSRAMVVGAGACYETRKHSNAYNLVHYDPDSGNGIIYLRTYSDREGGFWTEDLLSYQDAPGKYAFDLFLEPVPAPSSDMVLPSVEVPEVPTDVIGAPSAVQRPRSGLDKWWAGRGYKSNPFAWSNAATVNQSVFPELFQAWHIDPNAKLHLAGLGPTPTLDTISQRESGLILIYAPPGGGKTFYRRLAAQQIEEYTGLQCTLEIPNVAARVPSPKSVIARDLALCVFRRVCERFLAQAISPPDANVACILKQCDKVIARSSEREEVVRVYVFIDDLHQLFSEQTSKAKQNAQALGAVLNFCTVAAERGGGEPLALRMFIPEQLREPIQEGLGEQRRARIEECTLSWSAEHCHGVIERRLSNCWSGDQGPELVHTSRLLTPDALEEFLDWLRQQEGTISPRCVIKVFDQLARYAYGRGVTTEQIGVELWKAFMGLGESGIPCAQDISYPLATGRGDKRPPVETPTPDQHKYDAFISYSHRDKEWVHGWLLTRLEEAGLRVCVDFRDFEPGASSITEMERAVLQSRKTLLLLTPDYLASEWAEFENILASTLDPAARQRRVIPLLLKRCELPLRIRAVTYLDFTSLDHEFQLQRLLAAIRQHLLGGS